MSTEDENDNVSSDTAVDRDGEQQGRGEAAEDRGSWAVQDEDTPSPNLREAWPRVNVDGDKGLVVCTVDVQLLTGGCLLVRWDEGAGVSFAPYYGSSETLTSTPSHSLVTCTYMISLNHIIYFKVIRTRLSSYFQNKSEHFTLC